MNNYHDFIEKLNLHDEEINYLDPNIKLKTQEYYSVNAIKPSPNNSLIAYLEDNNGRREHDIKIIDALTLEIVDSELKELQEILFGLMITIT